MPGYLPPSSNPAPQAIANPFEGKAIIVKVSEHKTSFITYSLKEVQIRELAGAAYLVGKLLYDQSGNPDARTWIPLARVVHIAEYATPETLDAGKRPPQSEHEHDHSQ
jgi:hypothetical protein